MKQKVMEIVKRDLALMRNVTRGTKLSSFYFLKIPDADLNFPLQFCHCYYDPFDEYKHRHKNS